MTGGRDGCATGPARRPRVSFGLPVYNGERYLAEAIASVLCQDEHDLELVISDNASTDRTPEICERAARSDPRVRYVRHEVNRGGAWNFRHVLDLARGEYFTWICADDRKTAEFTRACLDVLERPGSEAVMAYTRTRFIDPDGAPLRDLDDADLGLDDPEPSVRVERLLRAEASPVFYGLIRTAAVRRTRGPLPTIAIDIVLLVELACQGRLEPADVTAFEFRRHAAQASLQGSRQMVFYRPRGRARLAFPHNRVNLEILRGIRASHLPPAQRARCYVAAGRGWIVRRWRAALRDVVDVVLSVRGG